MKSTTFFLTVAIMTASPMWPAGAYPSLQPDVDTQKVAHSIRVRDVATIELDGFDFVGPVKRPLIIRDHRLIAAFVHGLQRAQFTPSSRNFLDTLTVSFAKTVRRRSVDFEFSSSSIGTSFGPDFNRALHQLEVRNAEVTRAELRELGAQSKRVTLDVVTTKRVTLTNRGEITAVIHAITSPDQPLCDYTQGYRHISLTFDCRDGHRKQMLDVAINTHKNTQSDHTLRHYYTDLAPKG